MFDWLKKKKVEVIKKCTEEELMERDEYLIATFDEECYKKGKYIVMGGQKKIVILPISDILEYNVNIQKLSLRDRWQRQQIKKGYVWKVTTATIRSAFYSKKKAQEYLDKFLELIS